MADHEDRRTANAEASESLDRLLGALEHRRRRYALYHLRRAGGSASVEDIAAAVTATDGGPPGGAPDRDRTAIELRHRHLPRLVEAGLVRVETGDDGDVAFLRDLPPRAVEWLDRTATAELE